MATVIPGLNTTDQVRANLEWMRAEISAGLWAELKSEGLLRPDAPVP